MKSIQPENIVDTQNMGEVSFKTPKQSKKVTYDCDKLLLRKDTVKKSFMAKSSTKQNNLTDQIKNKLDFTHKIDPLLEEFYIGERTVNGFTVKKEFIQHQEQGFKTFYQIVRGSTTPIASLLMIHGSCEHSTRNLGIALKLASSGLCVHQIDLRGHGYSSGPVHMMSMEDILVGIADVLKKIPKGLPLYLTGHSLGGGSVLSFLKLNPDIKVAGVITSSAFIKLPKLLKVNPIKVGIVSNLPTFFDRFSINCQIHPWQVSRCANTVRRLVTDPIILPIVTFRFLKTLIKISKCVTSYDSGKDFGFPILMMGGERDQLTAYEIGKQFLKTLKTKDKSSVCFSDGKISRSP